MVNRAKIESSVRGDQPAVGILNLRGRFPALTRWRKVLEGRMHYPMALPAQAMAMLCGWKLLAKTAMGWWVVSFTCCPTCR